MKHTNPMRLNDRFFKEDLKNYLDNELTNKTSRLSMYNDIRCWIDNYDKRIEENNKKILQLCR
jgi:hypothetical protein